MYYALNPLSVNPTKWLNTLKQFVGKLPTNCLSVFGHFVNLELKVLMYFSRLQSLFLSHRLLTQSQRWKYQDNV